MNPEFDFIELKSLRIIDQREHITFLEQIDSRLFRADLSQLRGEMQKLEEFWKTYYPDSQLKQIIVAESNAINNLLRDQMRGVISREILNIERKNWVLRFQSTLSELILFVEEESERERIEQETLQDYHEEIQIKEALQIFEELDFDEEQTIEFNQNLRGRIRTPFFIIHGPPGHGQQWVYNKLLNVNKFFYSNPMAKHLLIDLACRSVSCSKTDIRQEFEHLGVKSTGSFDDWIKEATLIFKNFLRDRHVIITFRNPCQDALPLLFKIYGAIEKELSDSNQLFKLIFFIELNRPFKIPPASSWDLKIPASLSPVYVYNFRNWVKSCCKLAYSPIMEIWGDCWHSEEELKPHFVELGQEDWADEVDENTDEVEIPAETFIRKIAQDKLKLNWAKCKTQWIKY